jgi:hypothetical protein
MDNLWKADKPQQAQVIREYTKDFSSAAVMDSIRATDCYVLDGGSLLHRLLWNKEYSYGTIIESYAEFTVRDYGQGSVVFDGYGTGDSIKDNTQQRKRKH